MRKIQVGTLLQHDATVPKLHAVVTTLKCEGCDMHRCTAWHGELQMLMEKRILAVTWLDCSRHLDLVLRC